MLRYVHHLIADAQSPCVPFDVCIKLCKLLLVLHARRNADLTLHLRTYPGDSKDITISSLCLCA